jgi:sugar phosphate isomerase/epimerase
MPDVPAAARATAPPLLVSLSSFGAAEVRRHGQLWFTRLAQAAGADGVEVRGELLVDAASELPALAAAVQDGGLRAVFSCPDPLWSAEGAFDAAALDRALVAACCLGATQLKMSIGGFGPASLSTLAAVRDRLRAADIELLIENDQTVSAGTLCALQDFFAAAHADGLDLGMTFDMGNWHWTGESPLQAAKAMAPWVRYVHCKGVQRQAARWVAVPFAESMAPWRAVLRALPHDVPRAIEYPLAGDDLLAVTREQLAQLRAVTASL